MSFTPLLSLVRSKLTVRSNDSMEHHFFGEPGENFQMSPGMSTQHHVMPVATGHLSHTSQRQHGAFKSGNQFSAPPSVQSDIVSSRGNQVSEHFGQITPPNDTKSESVTAPSPRHSLEARKSQEEDIAKMNRTQRARNAANKRHSKSKAARRDSLEGNASETGEGSKDQKSTNLQREKNRVAAAKCRAKKKANSEEMQQSHREESKTNSYLLREMRELRDQKAFLRNSLLQHEPGLCQCNAIHRFNMAQAQQLAFGVGAMVGQPMSPLQVLSPSQDSVSSVQTPSSDTSAGRMIPTVGPVGAPRRTGMPSKRQSFTAPSSYAFGQITSPDPTLSVPATAAEFSQTPQQFADFLHSSPGGRSGFS